MVCPSGIFMVVSSSTKYKHKQIILKNDSNLANSEFDKNV